MSWIFSDSQQKQRVDDPKRQDSLSEERAFTSKQRPEGGAVAGSQEEADGRVPGKERACRCEELQEGPMVVAGGEEPEPMKLAPGP